MKNHYIFLALIVMLCTIFIPMNLIKATFQAKSNKEPTFAVFAGLCKSRLQQQCVFGKFPRNTQITILSRNSPLICPAITDDVFPIADISGYGPDTETSLKVDSSLDCPNIDGDLAFVREPIEEYTHLQLNSIITPPKTLQPLLEAERKILELRDEDKIISRDVLRLEGVNFDVFVVKYGIPWVNATSNFPVKLSKTVLYMEGVSKLISSPCTGNLNAFQLNRGIFLQVNYTGCPDFEPGINGLTVFEIKKGQLIEVFNEDFST